MTEQEWLDCSNLQRMLNFVRPRATLHKMLAFAAAFDRLIPRSSDHEHGQEDALDRVSAPAPDACAWPHSYLIDALVVEILRRAHQQTRLGSFPPERQRDWMHVSCALLRDIFAPFQSVTLAPNWLSANDGAVRKLASFAYAGQVFDHLPILADALEEAGCTEQIILDHLRGPGLHARGCWVLDSLLGKE